MNIDNTSDTIEAFYIHLLSSVEAAFQEVYEDYVENYEKFEMVVIDLQNRRVTEKKSAMLFGRLLMEGGKGIVTYDGYLIKRPEIEITLPDEGQTLAKIAL